MQVRVQYGFGVLALAIGGSIALAHELGEGEVPALDQMILLGFDRARTPQLTAIALDITALGSPTLLFLFSGIAVATFLLLQRKLAAIQMAVSSLGAIALSVGLKHWVERARPSEVPPLVEVSGFSYPSGHSLSAAAFYATLALILHAHLRPRALSRLVATVSIVVTVLVSFSRVYLGVHYPTDTVGGIALGAAWALLLDGFFFAHSKAKSNPAA